MPDISFHDRRGETNGGGQVRDLQRQGRQLPAEAGNGEIIGSSDAYESKASAKNGVAFVQKNAGDAQVVDLTQ